MYQVPAHSLSPALAASTSCTFGNKLPGYLKTANCSESFTQWVMGHVCLIKIQLLYCSRPRNLSLQVMKYDEISYSNWFSMGSSLNQPCYDKQFPVLKVLQSLSILAYLLQQNKNIVPQEQLHHRPSSPFILKHLQNFHPAVLDRNKQWPLLSFPSFPFLSLLPVKAS